MLYIEAKENEVALSESPAQPRLLRTQLQVAEDRADQIVNARRLELEKVSEDKVSESDSDRIEAVSYTKLDWRNITLFEIFEVFLSTLLKFAVMGLIFFLVIFMLQITANALVEDLITFSGDALNSALEGYVGKLSG